MYFTSPSICSGVRLLSSKEFPTLVERSLQPMGELVSIATHLLSLTGELFKKANKWLRSPSFKVGQPRPSFSAFAYMRGP